MALDENDFAKLMEMQRLCHQVEADNQRLRQLAGLARQGIEQWDASVAALASEPYSRVIYLGSGPHEALAREAFRLAAAKLPLPTTFVVRQVGQ